MKNFKVVNVWQNTETGAIHEDEIGRFDNEMSALIFAACERSSTENEIKVINIKTGKECFF